MSTLSEAQSREGEGPIPTTMQAVVQTEYGSADTFDLREVDRPTVEAGEVLVKVHAAGVGRGTWHLMTGQPYVMRIIGFGFRRPKNAVPGLDLAGTVVAVGSAVTRFSVGDEVFGIGRGAFAQYACAPEDKLVRKPAKVTFAQAAAVGVSGLAALQALVKVGRLEPRQPGQPGQHVLIIGASGGVGTFAIQIAKALGAEVTGVCRTAKVDLVKSIGADHVVDYTKGDFTAGPERYDLVIDIGGNTPLSRLRRVLTRRGTLVIAGGEHSGRWIGLRRQLWAVAISPFLRQRLTMFLSTQNRPDLERLAQMIEAGQVTPIVGQMFALPHANEALRHLESGQAQGKIVITVADGA